MVLTNRQKDCVEKAKKYRKKNMSTKPFRQLYEDFCIDGYASGNDFIQLVEGTGVKTLPPQTKEKPIIEYINFFERRILGKDKIGAKTWPNQ